VKPKNFMLIAGETSGDLLAAELVQALRAQLNHQPVSFTWDYQPLQSSLEPRFFGAGGPQMATAGVDLGLDLTAHSVTGFSDVLKNYGKFRHFFHQLYHLALEREPDAIVCVDFSGFNRRFAHAIKTYVSSRRDWFHDWNPKLIQYVSPQVWASRENRVYQLAKDFDLILSILPFEHDWYAARVPNLPVEFGGHPIVDRHGPVPTRNERVNSDPESAMLLLLPGSRPGELDLHLPVLSGALEKIRSVLPTVRAQMVLPSERLLQRANRVGLPKNTTVQIGGLPDALRQADLAIASTGTVTMECGYFGVPTIALYKTSWATWQIAKRIITVKYGSGPNLLANREIYPEFIQDAATSENIGRAALELLQNPLRRQEMRRQLAEVPGWVGPPGAAIRAAKAILEVLKPSPSRT
jgi:lipid-A-disaccharide synthase